MTTTSDVIRLTDGDLLLQVRRLAADERGATVRLIAALAELDARRLYLDEGCSSLFTYCTQVLHLSEHAAYGRIEAARAACRFPLIFDRLAAGEITLTTITMLAPHLTPANYRGLLDAARHKSKRDVERQVAELRPQPEIGASIRKLPPFRVTVAVPGDAVPQSVPVPTFLNVLSPVSASPRSVGSAATLPDAVEPSPMAIDLPSNGMPPAMPPPRIAALALDRYRVQFTINTVTHDKLRRAQDLLRHVLPNGDPAEIFDRALTLLVTQLESRRAGVSRRRSRLALKPTAGERGPEAGDGTILPAPVEPIPAAAGDSITPAAGALTQPAATLPIATAPGDLTATTASDAIATATSDPILTPAADPMPRAVGRSMPVADESRGTAAKELRSTPAQTPVADVLTLTEADAPTPVAATTRIPGRAEVASEPVPALRSTRPRPAATQPTGNDSPVARRSRYVPAALRRAVWARDDGQCAFVGRQGRCGERGMLELHHVVPFAEGGTTTIDNLELRCRAHNAHEARLWANDLWESALNSVRTELNRRHS